MWWDKSLVIHSFYIRKLQCICVVVMGKNNTPISCPTYCINYSNALGFHSIRKVLYTSSFVPSHTTYNLLLLLFSQILCMFMNVMTVLWSGLEDRCSYHSSQHPASATNKVRHLNLFQWHTTCKKIFKEKAIWQESMWDFVQLSWYLPLYYSTRLSVKTSTKVVSIWK